MDKNVESKYDCIAKDYFKLLKDKKYYKEISDKFTSKVKGKILDVGCGNGIITNYLFSKNQNTIGVDISSKMLNEAKKKYPKIKFKKMDMKALNFKDETFNGVFCFQAFEHIPPEYQRKVLSEFYRTLQKGGILMFNTNNLLYPKRFLAAIANKVMNPSLKFGEIKIGGQTKTYRYLSKFSKLDEILKEIGFKIIYYENPKFSKWIQIWAQK
jgi:ubiquinone/menaquinone biosynthesis C-methylase UbiE